MMFAILLFDSFDLFVFSFGFLCGRNLLLVLVVVVLLTTLFVWYCCLLFALLVYSVLCFVCWLFAALIV